MAKKEIERLQKEVEKVKCLSRFGLLRYSYNDDMLSSVNTCADKIKTWTQEQRARVTQNSERPAAEDHNPNNVLHFALRINHFLFTVS